MNINFILLCVCVCVCMRICVCFPRLLPKDGSLSFDIEETSYTKHCWPELLHIHNHKQRGYKHKHHILFIYSIQLHYYTIFK